MLKNKNIIITGAGRGIGKAIAIACAKEGANVGITSRTLQELNETKNEIEALKLDVKVIIKTTDITKYHLVEKIFKEFKNELRCFNGVIANAGASKRGLTHEFDSKIFNLILKVNVLGVFNTFKAAYPYFKKDNKKSKARFIITGSAAYPNAMPQFAAYTASKYAVVGLQKELALEYKRENILFNSVLPTMVDTRLLRGRKAGDGNKPENVLNPWDLNDYYIFLLSEFSNRINNELIFTNDIEMVKNLLNNAPPEKAKNWETFKEYLEEKASKIYNKVKKLGKLIDFLIKRSN
ncbi:MAG: SDR family NAD(P)-dependent oxidoreductase [Promethearchaeota archaeon]